ncbi:LytTR family DNA-binding domain-containing protein [Parabacteroides sp. ZJ-118]|uniref:LytTR family DNA-binding domain-containing protein n=1 Tax=Parabacteroides sp. ZJ-118 TaxID=2709398 RepID=UPI0013EC89EC|nr:LytTR family DNA-binding domain-containing protein [Parabacteroides sp. ZJ-118]
MEILLFNTRDELIRVNLKYVVYFEADGNYTHIIFSNATKVTLPYSLGNIEKLIDEKSKGKARTFVRVGERYIVNSVCVFRINTFKHKLLLADFETSHLFTLSVSKEALKSLKSLYMQE